MQRKFKRVLAKSPPFKRPGASGIIEATRRLSNIRPWSYLDIRLFQVRALSGRAERCFEPSQAAAVQLLCPSYSIQLAAWLFRCSHVRG